MMPLCLLTAIAGFTALCLGMGRHQRDVLGTSLSARASRRLKALGWTGVTASFVLAIVRDGPALGSVYALGELTLSALAVALVASRLASRR